MWLVNVLGEGHWGEIICSFPEWLAAQIQIVLSRDLWISRVCNAYIFISIFIPPGPGKRIKFKVVPCLDPTNHSRFTGSTSQFTKHLIATPWPFNRFNNSARAKPILVQASVLFDSGTQKDFWHGASSGWQASKGEIPWQRKTTNCWAKLVPLVNSGQGVNDVSLRDRGKKKRW